MPMTWMSAFDCQQDIATHTYIQRGQDVIYNVELTLILQIHMYITFTSAHNFFETQFHGEM